MVAKMCLECIRNNEEPTAHFLHILLAQWFQNTDNFRGPLISAVRQNAGGSMFLDDKSLRDQVVAQLHIWLILSH